MSLTQQRKKNELMIQMNVSDGWSERSGRNGVSFDGTSSDNESVHHHADQYDSRICRADWVELHDSFDPCR